MALEMAQRWHCGLLLGCYFLATILWYWKSKNLWWASNHFCSSVKINQIWQQNSKGLEPQVARIVPLSAFSLGPSLLPSLWPSSSSSTFYSVPLKDSHIILCTPRKSTIIVLTGCFHCTVTTWWSPISEILKLEKKDLRITMYGIWGHSHNNTCLALLFLSSTSEFPHIIPFLQDAYST